MADNQRHSLTHLGNASRILAAQKDNMRYDTATGTWLFWKGRRWVTEIKAEKVELELMQYGMELLNTMRSEWALATVNDSKYAEILDKWCAATENKLLDTVRLTRKRANELASRLADWDSQHSLITLDNGTLDLRTGELRPSAREDRMTKRLYVPYIEAAQCPRWLQFLDEIFAGNEQLIAYIQRLVGYCLTGETREQACFFLYGPLGSNGKSTFIDVMTDLLGLEYLKKIPTKAIMRMRNSGSSSGADENIASLRGARVAFADETNLGDRLNAQLIKEITGQEWVTTRQNYGSNFSFWPTAKFFLICNDLPEIEGADDALWRRIQCVPFEVHIPKEKRNLNIHAELKEELPGILLWAAQGARNWYEKSLAAPDEVLHATAEYREDEDLINAFINDDCVLEPTAEVVKGHLYSSYGHYCEMNKQQPLSSKQFNGAMKRKGFSQSKSNNPRKWRGLKIKPMGRL